MGSQPRFSENCCFCVSSFFHKVFEVSDSSPGIWQLRLFKSTRTMNIQKQRSIRVQYLMNYNPHVSRKTALWWPAVLLFFRHRRAIFSALPLAGQKHRVLQDIMHFRHKSGVQGSANSCCLHSPNLLFSKFPSIDCVLK